MVNAIASPMVQDGAGGGAIMLVIQLVMLVLFYAVPAYFLMQICNAKGKPAWMAWVPIANVYVIVEIAGKPIWWLAVILLVPCVGLIFMIMAYMEFAKACGASAGLGVLAALLPFIGMPMIAAEMKKGGGGGGGGEGEATA